MGMWGWDGDVGMGWGNGDGGMGNGEVGMRMWEWEMGIWGHGIGEMGIGHGDMGMWGWGGMQGQDGAMEPWGYEDGMGPCQPYTFTHPRAAVVTVTPSAFLPAMGLPGPGIPA